MTSWLKALGVGVPISIGGSIFGKYDPELISWISLGTLGLYILGYVLLNVFYLEKSKFLERRHSNRTQTN